MSLSWQWDGNRSDNETRSEYRAVLEIEAWVFSSAQRPALKTNGAGESFPTSDLCSSESDFGLSGKGALAHPSGTVGRPAPAGLAGAETLRFQFPESEPGASNMPP